jgi:hypothetical protein
MQNGEKKPATQDGFDFPAQSKGSKLSQSMTNFVVRCIRRAAAHIPVRGHRE